MKTIELEKCPCCDRDPLDKIKDMFLWYDTHAAQLFEIQNETRDYSTEYRRVAAQGKADIIKYVIDLLEGRGGCL